MVLNGNISKIKQRRRKIVSHIIINVVLNKTDSNFIAKYFNYYCSLEMLADVHHNLVS